jgi:dolichol-phosphate mannosyltransferase
MFLENFNVMQKMVEISVVVPVYGSPTTLVELVDRLTHTLTQLTTQFEIILVNDGSPDDSWSIVLSICDKFPQVIGINLSRNFGQHLAIHAGLSSSSGHWIVVMDCDLQDRPEEITKLYRKAQEGFQQVVAIRNNRQDSAVKRVTSVIFFKVLSFLTDEQLDHRIGNFGIYERRVIDSLLTMGDKTRTFSVLVRWVGFARTSVEVQHGARLAGQSSYTVRGLLSLAMKTIVGSSQKPLRIAMSFGFAVSLISILSGAWIAFQRLSNGVSVVGWTSTIVIMAFLLGITIASIGILGLYVGQIFEQVKDRPLYLIESMTRKKQSE